MNVTPVDERFADMIRAARAVSRLPQRRLADLMTGCGYPWGQQTIARVETNRRTVSIGEAAALSAILRMDVSLAKLGADFKVIELCAACADKPPQGFTCNTCGRPGS